MMVFTWQPLASIADLSHRSHFCLRYKKSRQQLLGKWEKGEQVVCPLKLPSGTVNLIPRIRVGVLKGFKAQYIASQGSENRQRGPSIKPPALSIWRMPIDARLLL